MMVCTNCYKKLYHQMITPYDYYLKDGAFLSTCCDAETLQIDGRRYQRTVKMLEEKKNLETWGTRSVTV